jgi:hypothetical protein
LTRAIGNIALNGYEAQFAEVDEQLKAMNRCA